MFTLSVICNSYILDIAIINLFYTHTGTCSKFFIDNRYKIHVHLQINSIGNSVVFYTHQGARESDLGHSYLICMCGHANYNAYILCIHKCYLYIIDLLCEMSNVVFRLPTCLIKFKLSCTIAITYKTDKGLVKL